VRNRWLLLVVVLLVFASAREGMAIIGFSETGEWPETWPQELEPLRASSRTMHMMTGTQENVYEIPFTDRETFEQVWPAILRARSLHSPITLHRVEPDGGERAQKMPLVQIYGPSDGLIGWEGQPGGRIDSEKLATAIEQGRAMRAAPPWPDEIIADDGSLPEYVADVKTDGRLHWVPVETGEKTVGFRYRCRVEVHLYVDGEIIDLNRIKLPAETPIVDLRFNE
jgi:hypothetical protein